MPLIDQPDKAIRLARAIASDILLYNDAKVIEGIVNDTLFDVLSEELEEGRQLYRSRLAPQVDPQEQDYWAAIVNVIVRAKAGVESKIW